MEKQIGNNYESRLISIEIDEWGIDEYYLHFLKGNVTVFQNRYYTSTRQKKKKQFSNHHEPFLKICKKKHRNIQIYNGTWRIMKLILV